MAFSPLHLRVAVAETPRRPYHPGPSRASLDESGPLGDLDVVRTPYAVIFGAARSTGIVCFG